ncbi:MAG TPA: site-2 protease family protein [Gemmataceae bacterium]|nr:site-2 protease family protein [Gemmataceae bacterium]
MFGSWKLGKIAGIDTFVHGTFWLLPLLVLFNGSAGGLSADEVGLDLALVFGVFACVLLHELGHALAARYYGIRTADITLYPIGGVARLERMPESPGREIAVALAGPAVNIVIAGGLFLGILATSLVVPGSWTTPGFDFFEQFVTRLFFANLFLAAFNLLPAFPMDGGRVFRALLSLRLSRVRATEVAVFVGGLMALGFFALGLYASHPMLMLLAVAVFLMGKAELAQVRWVEAERTWNQRLVELFQYDPPDGVEPDAFTGWKFDPDRRVWTEWRNGVPLRDVR